MPAPEIPGAVAAEPVPVATAPIVDRAAWREGPAHGRGAAGSSCASCHRSAFRGGDTTRPALTGPEEAAQLLIPALAHLDRERCVAALLDTKHRLIEQVVVSIGSVDHTFMAPDVRLGLHYA